MRRTTRLSMAGRTRAVADHGKPPSVGSCVEQQGVVAVRGDLLSACDSRADHVDNGVPGGQQRRYQFLQRVSSSSTSTRACFENRISGRAV